MNLVGIGLAGFGPATHPLASAFLVQADVNLWEIDSHPQRSLESHSSSSKPRTHGQDGMGWTDRWRPAILLAFCKELPHLHTPASSGSCKVCQGSLVFQRTSLSYSESQRLFSSCPDMPS